MFHIIYIWRSFVETAGIIVKELDVSGYPKEKCKEIGIWYKMLKLTNRKLIPVPIHSLL